MPFSPLYGDGFLDDWIVADWKPVIQGQHGQRHGYENAEAVLRRPCVIQ